MGDLADFLNLVDRSTVSYQTFQGGFRVVECPAVFDRAMRALRDLMERAPKRSRVEGPGSSSFSGFFFTGIDDEPDESAQTSEYVARLWFERPDRYREQLVSGGSMSLLVRNGHRWWTDDAELGAMTNDDEDDDVTSSSTVESGYERLLTPSKLLTRLEFEPIGDGDVAGRQTARAQAYPTPSVKTPGVRSVGFGSGADQYELDVDADRGVILRAACRFGGDELELLEAVQVVFDEPLGPDTFVDGRRL